MKVVFLFVICLAVSYSFDDDLNLAFEDLSFDLDSVEKKDEETTTTKPDETTTTTKLDETTTSDSETTTTTKPDEKTTTKPDGKTTTTVKPEQKAAEELDFEDDVSFSKFFSEDFVISSESTTTTGEFGSVEGTSKSEVHKSSGKKEKEGTEERTTRKHEERATTPKDTTKQRAESGSKQVVRETSTEETELHGLGSTTTTLSTSLPTTTTSTTRSTTSNTQTTTAGLTTIASTTTAGRKDTFELKITPSIYRLIDEAFRERLQDFEKKMASLMIQRDQENSEHEFLENDAFEEFERIFLQEDG